MSSGVSKTGHKLLSSGFGTSFTFTPSFEGCKIGTGIEIRIKEGGEVLLFLN